MRIFCKIFPFDLGTQVNRFPPNKIEFFSSHYYYCDYYYYYYYCDFGLVW